MDPIIWAAVIAGGSTATVAVVGSVTTVRVTRATLSAEVEHMREERRDERREAARQERGELYGRMLVVITRLEEHGRHEQLASDDEFEQTMRDFEVLLQDVLLRGTDSVRDAMAPLSAALGDIGEAKVLPYSRSVERFRAAYEERGRGGAVTAARGPLIRAMRQDVAAPHLSE